MADYETKIDIERTQGKMTTKVEITLTDEASQDFNLIYDILSEPGFWEAVQEDFMRLLAERLSRLPAR